MDIVEQDFLDGLLLHNFLQVPEDKVYWLRKYEQSELEVFEERKGQSVDFLLLKSRTHLAQTDTDFKFIYERELVKSRYGSLNFNYDIFKDTLIEKVDSYIGKNKYFNNFSIAYSDLESIARRLQSYISMQKDGVKELENLFYNPLDAERCINLLKRLKDPIIGSRNNYIGKASKSIFVEWVRLLKKAGYIQPKTDKIYARTLEKAILGLHFSEDASDFRKFYRKADDAVTELEKLIANL